MLCQLPLPSGMSCSAITGTVSEDEVSLTRIFPFVSNSYCPHFFGSFQDRAGGCAVRLLYNVERGENIYVPLRSASPCAGRQQVTVVARMLGRVTRLVGSIFWARFYRPRCRWVEASASGSRRNDMLWLSRTITNALITPEKLPPPEQQKEQLASPAIHRFCWSVSASIYTS